MSTEQIDNLTQQAVAGDSDALEQLLQLHHRRLLGYVNQNLSAELRKLIEPIDVVQDTYFEACRRIRDFRPEGSDSVFRWLARIAYHRILGLARARQAQKRRGNQVQEQDHSGVISLLEQLAVYHRTPSKSAAAHEFLVALEHSMGRLPEDYRQVLRLRHLEGLDVADTAARMNRSAGAISMLTNRALNALRNDLRSASLFV